MKRLLVFTAAAVACLVPAPAAGAADIIGWRTNWTGQYPAADPPLTWGYEKNVIWKVSTGTWSNATVVPYRDRLFYNEETATLVCAGKKDGEELWRVTTDYQELLSGGSDEKARKLQEEIAELENRQRELRNEDQRINALLRKDPRNQELSQQLNRIRQDRNRLRRNILARKRGAGNQLPVTHNTNGYSSATPLVADKHVFVLYGTGAAAAYDMRGERRWARVVGRPTNGWGHSASPVMADGTLILHLASTVYGLDPKTGETRWTATSNQFWGTPFPFRIGRKTWAVLTTGGVVIRAEDGRVLAKRVGAMPWSSPVAQDGVLYIVDEKGASAFRIPDNDEEPVAFERIWHTAVKRDRYYASPLIHEGLLYNVTQRGQLTVIDIRDGRKIYTRSFRFGGTYFPSVTLAGDHLFLSSDSGKTAVFLPGPEYREVEVNQLDAFRSNLVFEDDRIYLRTLRNLYCLGENP